MNNIASVVARLKHWQVFIIIMVPILLYVNLMVPPASPRHELAQFQSDFTRMMLTSLPIVAIVYGWIWAIGFVANKNLAPNVTRSDRLFNLSMPLAFGYVIFAIWAFPSVMLSDEPALPVAVVMPLHICATLLLFYAIIFAARSIGSLGRDQRSGLGRTFLFFLAILYFPIGLWFIQPRLNAVSVAQHEDR